jgi:inner membrane protein
VPPIAKTISRSEFQRSVTKNKTVDGVRTFDRARIHNSFAVLKQKDVGTFLVHPIDRPNELYQVSNRPDGDRQIFAERITGSVEGRIKTQLQTIQFSDEEIRPKLFALQSPSAQVYLSGSIEIEDPEELSIESNPQLYPSIVKRSSKLELDRCPFDRLLELSIDLWGTGQLTVKTVCSFGIDR